MGQLRQRGQVWWIRYYRNGRLHEESSGSTKKGVATNLLQTREGKIAAGVPISARINQFRFEAAAADLVTEYRINQRRSRTVLERRIEKHLAPYFGRRRMASITTADVRAFIAHRQTQGVVAVRGPRTGTRIGDVSNAEINRELAILKRMFVLAVREGKLLYRPHIPLLEERNTRRGFFELEQLHAVLAQLPAALRPPIEFAYVTGWRVPSEVLTLEWRQVDFSAGEVRLDPETTKNRDGRVFPMTDDLARLLRAQQVEHDRLRKAGQIVPWVFVRLVAKGRGGPKEPRRITAFTKAWQQACRAAGCPGRIPHDLRRTAVRNMVRRGVPERVAMQLAGHKTRSVFDRYNIVSPGDLRTAARALHALVRTIYGQSGPLSPDGESETREKH
jgi:integrase